eukprot:g22422.t1
MQGAGLDYETLSQHSDATRDIGVAAQRLSTALARAGSWHGRSTDDPQASDIAQPGGFRRFFRGEDALARPLMEDVRVAVEAASLESRWLRPLCLSHCGLRRTQSSPCARAFAFTLVCAMTVAAIPAPVTTRSQRRKWSERLFVAVLFIGLAARGGFSYPRGLNSTASNAATPGKASPMAFAHVAAPVEKEDGGYGRIATLVAIPALFVVMCRQTSKDILPPVMTGLFLWVILMSGIQQGIVPVPGLEGKQNEFLPIVLTFIAGYGIIVLEEVTEIHKTATALILGVMIWAFIGTGVTMPSEDFETAVSDTLKDISEVVFFLLGALTVARTDVVTSGETVKQVHR